MRKTYEDVCRNIKWEELAKARVSVKVLAGKKKSFVYLAKLLDELSEAALDTYNVDMTKIYPSLLKARLIGKAKKNKN